MDKGLKIYNLGGSCCDRRLCDFQGKKIFVKEINKNIQGIDNGYKKFWYEIQHMKNHFDTGLYPQIIYDNDDGQIYSVGMEYCFDGATLSDLIRNENVDIEYFYKSFDYIMEELFKRMYLLEKGEVDNKYLDICYFDRVANRLNKIVEYNMVQKYGFSNLIYRIMDEGCVINDIYYAPIMDYVMYMKNNVELRKKLEISYSTQCHYDLCPLNILVDVDLTSERVRDFKLIDVRGEEETGKQKRHFMYDMGKMLLGLDTFDLFRIFNNENETFRIVVENTDKIPQIHFSFIEGTIYERYKLAYDYFWTSMEKRDYYAEELNEDKENLRLQFLFSQSMMYHPDVPCRIIYEKNEKLAIQMYMRGLMCIKAFLYEIYGCDPVTHDLNKVDLWPK